MMVWDTIRRWRSRRRPARSVAVYGPGPIEFVPISPHLAGLVLLDNSVRSLAEVDQVLAEDPGQQLRIDAACYLGNVLVNTVEDASWELWPNGYPVVRRGRTEIDVIAEVRSGGRLSTAYSRIVAA